jgi:hypothetical protein
VIITARQCSGAITQSRSRYLGGNGVVGEGPGMGMAVVDGVGVVDSDPLGVGVAGVDEDVDGPVVVSLGGVVVVTVVVVGVVVSVAVGGSRTLVRGTQV